MSLVHSPDIGHLIHTIRNQRVILDSDLAQLYGVTTKVLNQAIKRNADRFPPQFMFQLTREEARAVRSQIVTLKKHSHFRHLPHAFTEHGALMAANVLNSTRAVKMSIAIIQTFIRLREAIAANHVMARRLAEFEKTLVSHDSALRDLYQKIRPLLLPPELPQKRIAGFGKPD